MQRLLISLSSLVALTASVYAQPAPEPPAAPPPVDPGAPLPPPAPEVVPPPKAEKKEDPKRLSVGKESPGSFYTPGLNMQGWFIFNQTTIPGADGEEDVTRGTSTFRLRRVELSAGGDILPKVVKWRFMFDLARVNEGRANQAAGVNATGGAVNVSVPTGPFSALQDAYITYSTQYADVLIGQFKNFVSWDGFNSAAKIILPDRAFGTSRVGGLRDIGVRVEKTFKKFAYYAGVFNGSGQNALDTNNQKDLALRLEVYPVPGLTIAGVTYDSVGYRKRQGTKDRWEGDLRYESGPFLFQSEYIQSRDVGAAGAVVKTQAFYGALAYMVKGVGTGTWKGDWQPVVRVGYHDPDTDNELSPTSATGADERWDFEAGINYYLRGHEVKFQLAYDRQQFDDDNVRTPINEVVFGTQVWF
jgi:hypothetical protein